MSSAHSHRREHSTSQPAAGQKDPVCGMTVLPESAAGSVEHGGSTYWFCSPSCLEKFRAAPGAYVGPAGGCHGAEGPANRGWLHLSHAPRGSERETRRVPEMRDGSRAGRGRARGQDRVRLPDASGGRPLRARVLPHLRDGPRASHGDGRRARQPRAARHDPSSLGQRDPHHAALPSHDGHHAGRPRGHGLDPARVARLDRAGAGDARGPVGRLALLRAHVGVVRQPKPEHVHADRHRHRHRLRLQRRGDALSGPLPGLAPRPRRRGRASTSKPRP